jgi:hypothetical protein
VSVVLTAYIALSDEEKLVLWTLGAIGRPVSRAQLAARMPRAIDLGRVLLLLRRFGLVRDRAPVDLTSEGMRKAAKLVNAQEANLSREIRLPDARDAIAEAGAPACPSPVSSLPSKRSTRPSAASTP